MKKFLPCLCLLLALLMPLTAFAAARMPAQRGTVTDDADVLSAQTAADIAEYAELVEEETGLRLHTVIVHFLDGLDAQTYAGELFERWNLGSADILLLAAAGEDSCATAMGSEAADRLGKANAENLMYTSSGFSTLIRSQQYDAAFNAYYTAMNTLIEKQLGASIRLGTLFGTASMASPARADYASQLWGEVMAAIEDSGDAYQQHYERHEEQDNGLTAGGWIVLIILIVIAVRQSRPLKHAPRKPRRSGCGCGCSPLAWLLGLLGLGALFDRD